MDDYEVPVAESRVSFPGPFKQHDVVVSGWKVPLLHAQPQDGGTVMLVLDNRVGLELGVKEAESVVPFLADCIAVALGYDAHPSSDDASLTLAPHPKPQRSMTVDFGGAGDS